ncbi:hypothetical protein BGY98DRAFT_1005568 [Russula aff. rugulosa BPL654]|nr:hypothetical protein BGY98DRAFT_1005568 [Russula aff. rugulosa BPL654]
MKSFHQHCTVQLHLNCRSKPLRRSNCLTIESSLKDAFDSVKVSSAIELPPHGQKYLPNAHATH